MSDIVSIPHATAWHTTTCDVPFLHFPMLVLLLWELVVFSSYPFIGLCLILIAMDFLYRLSLLMRLMRGLCILMCCLVCWNVSRWAHAIVFVMEQLLPEFGSYDPYLVCQFECTLCWIICWCSCYVVYCRGSVGLASTSLSCQQHWMHQSSQAFSKGPLQYMWGAVSIQWRCSTHRPQKKAIWMQHFMQHCRLEARVRLSKALWSGLQPQHKCKQPTVGRVARSCSLSIHSYPQTSVILNVVRCGPVIQRIF